MEADMSDRFDEWVGGSVVVFKDRFISNRPLAGIATNGRVLTDSISTVRDVKNLEALPENRRFLPF
jgi:hypothetical protein